MDAVLIAVTFVSLASALAMGVFLTTLLREERRRSDARVAALIEISSEPAIAAPIVAPAVAPASPKPRPVPAAAARIRLETAPPPATTPAVSPFDMLRPAEPVATADLFAEPEQSTPWLRRFAVIGALAIVGGSVLFAATLRRSGGADVTADTPAMHQTAADASPLELVSLRHSREGDVLTITGLVQNPLKGSPVSNITATAVVFAPDGTFVASGRAALDYTSLAAGDESPFVIAIPVKDQVARYRVGFRGKDGGVIAHIDRRNAEGVARR